MSQQEQLVLVCQLLGWKRGIHEEQSFSHPDKTIKSERWISPNGMAERKLPPLTSDLIWECLLKLTDDQLNEYVNKLSIITHNDLDNVQRLEWSVTKRILLASKEQRLTALVETIGGVK